MCVERGVGGCGGQHYTRGPGVCCSSDRPWLSMRQLFTHTYSPHVLERWGLMSFNKT